MSSLQTEQPDTSFIMKYNTFYQYRLAAMTATEPRSRKKVAIVTGASSGMGEALTRDLVSRGWWVAMADIQENQTLALDMGPRARFYHTDVSSYESQAATFQAVFNQRGRLDALCANAGICDKSSLYIFDHRTSTAIPPAPDTSCTDVDWKGVVYGTQLAIHFMRQNKPRPGGVIVATASVAAMHPHPAYCEYNGAKAAVVNFVRGMAPVLRAKEGIRINAVMPGIVDTAIVPPEIAAAAGTENITPISTITRAYDQLLESEKASGVILEGSVDKIIRVPDPPLLNGSRTKRAVTVYDPLFKYLHGEESGLQDAVKGEELQWEPRAGSKPHRSRSRIWRALRSSCKS
ncbi:15-hydroxyprostaglandin dehydrogenase [NAD(+)] [Teratosphaeria destructans]|uniref:15-hydroxyprostaglandin dehydrogenase [NAD(+)] n=1 Tax=Teratosphaeria destructans TaxID=418781 RepID=A0A9W7SRC0_9PEZI|nr:15-hydroxyprostaglandin dehydrogenase [NAD(+)] [Teratosphaeria destructans]